MVSDVNSPRSHPAGLQSWALLAGHRAWAHKACGKAECIILNSKLLCCSHKAPSQLGTSAKQTTHLPGEVLQHLLEKSHVNKPIPVQLQPWNIPHNLKCDCTAKAPKYLYRTRAQEIITWLILDSLEMMSYYSAVSVAQVLLKTTLEKHWVSSPNHTPKSCICQWCP